MRKGDALGRFVIEDDLGAGGMGEVYLARDSESGQMVALKVLHTKRVFDPAIVPRFVREAEVYRKLKHPNIVKYCGSGTDGDTYYIAIERVEGRTLEQLLEKAAGPLGVRKSILIAIDLLAALEYAHRKEIIHRDLKPGNVMVSKQGEVKLLDFGVARADDRLVQTQTGDLLGSFRYSSPEQNRGEPVDARSDLYSFGAVLYEMLTGQKALQGMMLQVIKFQLTGTPRSASSLVPEVPPGLDMICTRFLAPSTEARYQTASAGLEDLREFKDMAGF